MKKKKKVLVAFFFFLVSQGASQNLQKNARGKIYNQNNAFRRLTQ